MHLEDSQWPPSTGEGNSIDECDIDEVRSQSIETFVKYLNERFTVFSAPPLSLCRLWPRERSDLVSYGDGDENISVGFLYQG